MWWPLSGYPIPGPSNPVALALVTFRRCCIETCRLCGHVGPGIRGGGDYPGRLLGVHKLLIGFPFRHHLLLIKFKQQYK